MKHLLFGIFALVAISFLWGCEEDKIQAETDTPRYVVKDGDHPAEKYIYNFYNQYGSYILVDFKPIDYTWNLTRIMPVRMIKQPDKDVIMNGINMMEKVWKQFYSDSFIKSKFPYKIILADTIYDDSNIAKGSQVVNCYTGINYLAIGNIHAGVESLSVSDLNALKGEINGDFWGLYLYKYNMIDVPDAFFNASGADLYDTDLNKFLTEEDVANKVKIDPKDYGFWAIKDNGNSDQSMAPSKEEDVACFVKMICSTPKAQITQMMVSYPKLREKYNSLCSFILTQYKIDIQAIGDKQF